MATEKEIKWMQEKIEQAIDKIVEESANAEVFPDTYIGDDTIILMARAAMAVFLGVAEAQVYLVNNGYMKSL